MTRILSAFSFLKRVGFAVLLLGLATSQAFGGLDEWTQEGNRVVMSDSWQGYWDGPCLWQMARYSGSDIRPVRIKLSDPGIFEYHMYTNDWEGANLFGIFQHPIDTNRYFRADDGAASNGPDTLWWSSTRGAGWAWAFFDSSFSDVQLFWDQANPDHGIALCQGRSIWETFIRGQQWFRVDLPIDEKRIRVWADNPLCEKIYFTIKEQEPPYYFRILSLDIATLELDTLRTVDVNDIPQLIVDRSNPDRLLYIEKENCYLGEPYRLWHTLNQGETFEMLFETTDTNCYIDRVFQDYVNPQRWNMIVGNNFDLYVSTDGGYSWERTDRRIKQAIPLPNREGEILSLSPSYYYRPSATDTFRQIEIGPTDRGNQSTYDIYYSDESGLLVNIGSDMWRSFDGGFNWQPWGIVNGRWTTDVAQVGISSPANRNVMLKLVIPWDSRSSIDGGMTWHATILPPPADHRFTSPLLTMHPTDSAAAIAFGYHHDLDSLQILRTWDLGQTWQSNYANIWPKSFIMSKIVFYSTEPETLVIGGVAGIGDVGGFWYSADSGATWHLVPGMENEQGGIPIVDYENNRMIRYSYTLGGLARNDFTSLTDWYSIQGNLPSGGGAYFLDPDTSEIVYRWVGLDGIYKGLGDGVWERYIAAELVSFGNAQAVLPGWPKTFLVSGAGIMSYTKSQPLNSSSEILPIVQSTDVSITLFPNPTNGSTTIKWTLPLGIKSRTIQVINILGQQVADITVPENLVSGVIHWDLTGFNQASLSSGLYFVGSRDHQTFTKLLYIR
ncbi:MAG: T9SS type A sorting domain-containing protein [Calditrichaeota bacterium]|nr:T9SS type A sorting domain-containing protein [Calditrichota bacterium]MCB9369963.1 T9SS type A sorting domain-containing protein [Calditrichota bacterium]